MGNSELKMVNLDTEEISFIPLVRLASTSWDGSRAKPEGTRFSSTNQSRVIWGSDTMKLTYRGITYDYPLQPDLDEVGHQKPYVLTYRGLTYVVDPNARPIEDSLPVTYRLTYRGLSYDVVRNVPIVTPEPVPAAAKATTASTQAIAPLAKARPETVPSTLPRSYIGRIHKANLLQNVQRRLNVARERGDQELVRMLEAELRQIAA